jgi:hypothetical protein
MSDQTRDAIGERERRSRGEPAPKEKKDKEPKDEKAPAESGGSEGSA